jgi:hypothetical protein
VAFWIFAWVGAREFRAKRKLLNEQTVDRLVSQVLSATAIVETGDISTTHSAELKLERNVYVLAINIFAGSAPSRVIHEEFLSLFEAEQFLISETVFVLSDFKPKAPSLST